MNSGSYEIAGGDYEHGGSASSGLKEWLKKIGASAGDVRRAMIAAYEAEMNVVIHAYRGNMRFTLEPGQLDVEVIDEGPGIPDIDKAMEEGFSTAPPRARELGFGAGLGLPNIRKNSDRFSIESAVGRGTQVRFSIFLKSQVIAGLARNSVRVVPELCIGCLDCLRVCPTRALRIRGGRPVILEHLCIDCTACIQACRTGAITIATANEPPELTENTPLVLPGAFFAQFGAGVGSGRVMEALTEIGVSEVRFLEEWESAVREATLQYAREEGNLRPVIAPTCGAVLNLIETRFPSLIGHVAPFLTPIEAAREELAERPTAFVVSCPHQHTVLALRDPTGNIQVVHPGGLRRRILPGILEERRQIDAACGDPQPITRDAVEALQVSGVRHVVNVLEEIENGLLNDVGVVEPYACEQGCFGSPLLGEDPYVTRYRWERMTHGRGSSASAFRRKTLLSARPGLRLDSDMSQAIAKLAKIDEITRGLGGKNCGLCGSPSCAALAEDIVMGRAPGAGCRRLADRSEDKA
jgi:anti-sigma regulatory factor (Ser/Thr protein kinase)/Pyruvate/2-oxoacid:ferredoxin oxidoreductase delta subunit